jgi:hypothetical protein
MFHGPATLDLFGRIIVFALSILFGFLAFAPNTRVRGAFSYGKGPGVPINTAGRVILFLIALVLFLLALGVLQ